MWLLAQAPAATEFAARDRLDTLGVPAWVPTFRREIRPKHVHGTRLVAYPLFARYLFLESFDPGRTMAILRTDPHVRPVRSDLGNALLVPDRDIAAVRARSEAGAFDLLPDGAPFPAGVRCIVSIGHVWRNAVVERVLSHARRRLTLDGSSLAVVASVDLIQHPQ